MKKKLFLVIAIVAVLTCLFAISVCAESVHANVDKTQQVTLSDGTTLDLFDAEANALIWYVDANSTTGYSSIRADEKTNGKVDYQVNSWAGSTQGEVAHQVDTIVITDANGNTFASSTIVVFNIMDDDVTVTTSKQGNAPVGSTVNSIASVFKSNTNIQYAYLRLDTNSVHGESFRYASNLKYVNLAQLTNLRQISKYAFQNCTSLFAGQTLDLSNTILKAFDGEGIFANVPMTGIVFPSTITSLGSSWCLQGTALTSVTIPSTITTIPGSTFKQCKSLESVTFDGDITTIGASAFYQCSALKDITLPSTLTKINGSSNNSDDGAFEGCTSLESITIPASLKDVYGNVFTSCTALENVIFEERNGEDITFYGWSPFEGCTSLKRLELPEGMTSLANAFAKNCKALEYIYLPTTLKTLNGNSHFADAGDNAESLVVEGLENTKLTRISDKMFQGATKWAPNVIRLPNTCLSIDGSYAFADVPVKTVYLGAAMQTISTEAFVNCPVLQAVYIPSTVTSINSNVFNNKKTNNILFIVASEDADVFAIVENAAQTGKTSDQYISYADFKANPDNYLNKSGRNIVYGANTCEIFYKNAHTAVQAGDNYCTGVCSRCGDTVELENPQHVNVWEFTNEDGGTASITAVIIATETCQNCKHEGEVKTIDAIFKSTGYSYEMNGNEYTGIYQKTSVDTEALALYSELTGNKDAYNFGIVAGLAADANDNPIDGNLITATNGEANLANETTVIGTFLNTEYTIMEIKVTGVTSASQLYCGAFIVTGNDVTYLCGTTQNNVATKATFPQ